MSHPQVITQTEEQLLMKALQWGRNYRDAPDPAGLVHRLRTDYQTSSPRHFKLCRNTIAALLMLDAGLRVGEVVGLQVLDVAYRGVVRSMLTIDGGRSKSGHDRQIPLSARLAYGLGIYLAFFPLASDLPWTTPLICTQCMGPAITPRQLERVLADAALLLIGKTIWPHMLRHTFATRLAGVTDLVTVQDVLGHKSLSSTQIYTHPSPERKSAAIEAMNLL